LNISIKDIQRIFQSFDSEIVLEVLGRKVPDIDDEVVDVFYRTGMEIEVAFLQPFFKLQGKVGLVQAGGSNRTLSFY
jgi:hypothetical protein